MKTNKSNWKQNRKTTLRIQIKNQLLLLTKEAIYKLSKSKEIEQEAIVMVWFIKPVIRKKNITMNLH